MIVMAPLLAPLYKGLMPHPIFTLQVVDTPLEDISKIHTSLHITFTSRNTFFIPWRQHQHLQIARMLQEDHSFFASTVYADLSKSALEGYIGDINQKITWDIISAKRVIELARENSCTGYPDRPEP
ncbi:hypothetical protein GYMLUDRAFT_253632 [Collybiopsis luxurians FD-317 M1]|uniref:Uncharacterized protein n=1 Tax=Collybiopsis luxurians FD-317 M1 TaxID=944289 RepID=A0A0D0BW00_9AGAR|nr:hypothetical protein GYMLUDRAFT_253632 [Collybiopsis luxurians FD-317 M1]